MNRREFVDNVLNIAQKPLKYRLGGDGSDGTCDCVGLPIGAMRAGGIVYKGLHGTNWAARNEARELWPIDSAADLSVGDCVLKAREPGDPGYNLPDRYKDGPDLLDYYHIGVVVSTAPLTIVHMSGPGICKDTTLGRWRFAFLWRQLSEYSNPDEPPLPSDTLYQALVVTESGHLNVRAAPVDGDVLAEIPKGAVVDVLCGGEWPFIRYGAAVGYVAGWYLERIRDEPLLPESWTTLASDDGQQLEIKGRWRVIRND